MGTQLIIAGFHRSGTSLTAQILHRAGVFLGHRMLPKHWSNPYGHFEDEEIVDLHEQILADNGLTWQVDRLPLPNVGASHRRRMKELIDRREDTHELWGFKDPRVCLFLSTWKELLPDARILLVYRSFAESTYSLRKRHAFALLKGAGRQEEDLRFWKEQDLALRMWLVHNKALLDFARAYPENVLAVSFDMLRREFPVVKATNQRWGLGLEETAASEVFDKNVTIRRDNVCPVSDEKLIGEVLDTWEAMERLGRRIQELTGVAVEEDVRLTEEVFYKPVEAYDLLIEREFLDLKVQFIEDRLREAEESTDSLKKRLEDVKNSRENLRTQLEKARIPPVRRRELERAEMDLKTIVKMMSESRLAPIFRLKRGFRDLEQRYLD